MAGIRLGSFFGDRGADALVVEGLFGGEAAGVGGGMQRLDSDQGVGVRAAAQDAGGALLQGDAGTGAAQGDLAPAFAGRETAHGGDAAEVEREGVVNGGLGGWFHGLTGAVGG